MSDPERGRESVSGSGKRQRARTILILIAVLVVPLVLLSILLRSGRREGGGAQEGKAATTSGVPPDEKEEPPSIRETAAAGRRPFDGLKEPRDAAIDGRGRIWLADFGHSRLRIFDGKGGYLGGWGGRGSGTFGFRDLTGVAIRNEDVYVADTWNGRV
ncbi:MAG TPA: hypothetical protein VGK70_08925, partial [Thermoanaerobaculia bacterium]